MKSHYILNWTLVGGLAACSGNGPAAEGESGSDASDASSTEGVEPESGTVSTSGDDAGTEEGDGCFIGTEGCPCTLDERCDPGLECADGTCKEATAVCGNGKLDPELGEECDQGDLNADDYICKSDCTLQICGDGVVGLGEACDDGNMVDADACSNDCRLPTCGDGIVQAGEVCDDGNGLDTDQCTTMCLEPACGDGIVHADETCDDGNADDLDGCTTACEIGLLCGDGNVLAGELCFDDEILFPAVGAEQMAVGDFNGDGRDEIATMTLTDLGLGGTSFVSLKFYARTDAGDWRLEQLTTFNAQGDQGVMTSGDFNGDGEIDLATAVGTDLTILFKEPGSLAPEDDWFFNTATQLTQMDKPRRLLAYTSISSPTRDDVMVVGADSDGGNCRREAAYDVNPADLLGGSSAVASLVASYENCSLTPFAVAIGTFAGSSPTAQDVIVGQPLTAELVLTTLAGASPSTPSSMFALPLSLPAGSSPVDMLFADLDDDGADDAVVVNNGLESCAGATCPTTKLVVQPGRADSSAAFPAAVEFDAGRGPIRVRSADLDGDGDLDLVVGYIQQEAHDIFLGDGAGGLDVASISLVGTDMGIRDLVIADFDGNGVPDVAALNQYINSISVFMGNP